MILTGAQIVSRQLVRQLRSLPAQRQPCGIDLTLRQISEWTSAAFIDYDNTNRHSSECLPLSDDNESYRLLCGAYLVDFNETIHVPKNYMASIYPRSSLWRSGASIGAGVIDAGYEGAIGALLEVRNPHGIVLHKKSKLAQVVFAEMSEMTAGYTGIYQHSTSSIGRDGVKQ